MKNLWQDCPQCDSGNVEPFNYWLIVAGIWALAMISYLFNAILALVVAVIALLVTLAAVVIKIMNYDVLKCKDCSKYWLYKHENKSIDY